MSARERLAETLRSPGLIGLREEEAIELIDAFAHELAEEQRAFVKREGVQTGDDPYTVGVRDVIDWIDPYFGAGPVRPDEEPTT